MSHVLIYVQHLLGIGHLQRVGLIADAAVATGLDVEIISGGVPVPGLLSDGVRLIQLPPLKAGAGGFRDLRDVGGRPADDSYRQARLRALITQVRKSRPKILVLEAFPFGRWPLDFELLPLLEAALALDPKPLIVSSVRDILQVSNKPGRSERVIRTLQHYFDAVLVHGDPKLAPLALSFARAAEVGDLLHHTGLVAAPEALFTALPSGEHRPGEILVSAGGGAIGHEMLRGALEARPMCVFKNLPWRVITGRGLDQAAFDRLRRGAPEDVAIERFRPDFRSLMARARLSVSFAGYNTVTDILRTGVSAVLVAYTGDGAETEQRTRALRLQELGVASSLLDTELTPERLADAIDVAASRPPSTAKFDLEGAKSSAGLLRRWVERGSVMRHI